MRIRKRVGAKLHINHADAAWFAAYEDRVTNPNTGKSRTASKKTTFTQEEHAAEASGTGTAAEIAASASMVYEEGRRQDLVVDRGITALEKAGELMGKAVDAYRLMAKDLLEERKQDAAVQRTLVEAVRENYVARAEAEAELIHQEADHAAREGHSAQDDLESQALQGMIDNFLSRKRAERNGKPNGKRSSWGRGAPKHTGGGYSDSDN